MSTQVTVRELPACDLCKQEGRDDVPAHYDGATIYGPWAYMCEAHHGLYGVGLGTGRGQKLVLS